MRTALCSSVLAATSMLALAGGATAQDLHPVETMLTILMDTSDSTIVSSCSGQTYFAHMRDGLLDVLDDVDIIPRDGRLVLGIYYYGTLTTEDPLCDRRIRVVVPPQRITSEADVQAMETAVLASSALAGNTALADAMECTGDDIALYKPTWSPPRTVLLVVAEGMENTGSNVPAARDELLDDTSGPSIVDEILVLGLESNIAGSTSDPAYQGTPEEYIQDNVVGPEFFGQVPYWIGETLDSVASFYALCDDACPEDPEELDDFSPRLQYIARLAVHRCSYDISGIPGTNYGDGKIDQSDLGALLAAYDTREGDPLWNPYADLDGNGHIFQPDLGILLAEFGCGTQYAP